MLCVVFRLFGYGSRPCCVALVPIAFGVIVRIELYTVLMYSCCYATVLLLPFGQFRRLACLQLPLTPLSFSYFMARMWRCLEGIVILSLAEQLLRRAHRNHFISIRTRTFQWYADIYRKFYEFLLQQIFLRTSVVLPLCQRAPSVNSLEVTLQCSTTLLHRFVPTRFRLFIFHRSYHR